MFLSRRFAAFLVLAASSLACNRPPVGLYETRFIENVEFVKRGEVSLCMDICVPRNAPTQRPAVVLFHGGGWVMGDRGYERDLAQFLAGMGYTAATASYRLCTDKGPHYPAPVQDALAAVKFVRAHAGDYGIDPSRIAVGGESAGGQLALLIGFVKDHLAFSDDSHAGVASDVCAVIDIYGPTDLVLLFDKGGYAIQRLGLAYLGCLPRDCPEKFRQASPVTYVRADAPPVLILHGDQDTVVPFDQARVLNEAIRRVGGRCDLVCVSRGRHGWGLLFNDNENMRTLPTIVQFLARVFTERSQPRP